MASATGKSVEPSEVNIAPKVVAYMIYGALFGFVLGIGMPLLNYLLGWGAGVGHLTGHSTIDLALSVVTKTFLGAFLIGIPLFLVKQYGRENKVGSK